MRSTRVPSLPALERIVEVTGSHVGLAFNRGAYRAIAGALAAAHAAV